MTRYLVGFCGAVILTAAVLVAAGLAAAGDAVSLSVGLVAGATVCGREGYRRGHTDERARAARIRARRATHREQATTYVPDGPVRDHARQRP